MREDRDMSDVRDEASGCRGRPLPLDGRGVARRALGLRRGRAHDLRQRPDGRDARPRSRRHGRLLGLRRGRRRRQGAVPPPPRRARVQGRAGRQHRVQPPRRARQPLLGARVAHPARRRRRERAAAGCTASASTAPSASCSTSSPRPSRSPGSAAGSGTSTPTWCRGPTSSTASTAWTATDLTPTYEGFLARIHPDDRGHVRRGRRGARSRPRTRSSSTPGSSARNGDIAWIRGRGLVTRDPEGRAHPDGRHDPGHHREEGRRAGARPRHGHGDGRQRGRDASTRPCPRSSPRSPATRRGGRCSATVVDADGRPRQTRSARRRAPSRARCRSRSGWTSRPAQPPSRSVVVGDLAGRHDDRGRAGRQRGAGGLRRRPRHAQRRAARRVRRRDDHADHRPLRPGRRPRVDRRAPGRAPATRPWRPPAPSRSSSRR